MTLRTLTTRRGPQATLPLFVPVYRPGFALAGVKMWDGPPEVEACMVNAFFLYKDRETRRKLEGAATLQEHIGFDGVCLTDSGAFQGFRRRLYLSNKVIVRFQDAIRSDIAAPLDLITHPGEKRSQVEGKMAVTLKRTAEAMELAQSSTIACIQQGGRFPDLRHECVATFRDMGAEYLGIGSLVPFFNKNHSLDFVGDVIRDARETIGPDVPMHVYGAGDPAELPFLAALGADIFDSSSYSHYAKEGYFMTPYGALKDWGPLHAGEYRCPCPVCAKVSLEELAQDTDLLALHNLWTLLTAMDRLREAVAAGTLERLLEQILERHQAWLPESELPASWEALSERANG